MKLTGVELRRIQMPLVAPFRTSFGVETTRDILLLRAVLAGPTGEAEGWGEPEQATIIEHRQSKTRARMAPILVATTPPPQ